MQVMGVPAQHASHLRREALRRLWLSYGASAAVAGGTLSFLAPGRAFAAGMLLALAPLAVSGRHRSAAARAAAGVRAERATAVAAARLDVEAVVHGSSPDGRGDVDHVLVGPCLVAVETKYGRGEVRVGADGRLSAGGRMLPRDPLGQAREAARKVERFCGAPCVPVLVVSGMRGRSFRAAGVTVCAPSDLAEVVGAAPSVLPRSSALAVARRLHAARG